MCTLVETITVSAKDHDVLRKSWTCDLRQLRFYWGYGPNEDGLLELELSTHEEYVVLRFSGVIDFRCEGADLISTVSIKIFDTSPYVPDVPAGIRVYSKGGGISFWAKAVVRVSELT